MFFFTQGKPERRDLVIPIWLEVKKSGKIGGCKSNPTHLHLQKFYQSPGISLKRTVRMYSL
jgi:hypothetical protein